MAISNTDAKNALTSIWKYLGTAVVAFIMGLLIKWGFVAPEIPTDVVQTPIVIEAQQ